MNKKTSSLPFPIFGTYSQTRLLSREFPYPEEIPVIRRSILECESNVSGCEDDYILAVEFLSNHGRVSAQTFNAFRTEIERFLLWSWIICEKSLQSLTIQDLNAYIDFCMRPPASWVNTHQERHFVSPKDDKASKDSSLLEEFAPSTKWKPFKVSEDEFSSRAESIKRNPSNATINRQFSIMSVFYDHLALRHYVLGNPMKVVKKFSPYIIKNSEPPEIKTFSKTDWEMILGMTMEKADKDPSFERNLFALVTLKSLYLRISEISERPNWSPTMNHFFKDKKGFYWLKVFGKGNKVRRVSLPNDYLDYLSRYREHRGMSKFPDANDESPLMHKSKGTQGLGIKQSTRLIIECFDHVIGVLKESGDEDKAMEISAASSHWLRHTGASIDAETRPIKHLSDDLGHSSMATTDKSYIQSTLLERAKTGSKREV